MPPGAVLLALFGLIIGKYIIASLYLLFTTRVICEIIPFVMVSEGIKVVWI